MVRRQTGFRSHRRGWLLATTLLLLPLAAAAAPFVPADEMAVLEQIPGAGDASGLELRRLNAALSQSPTDLGLAERVARQDIAEARSLGDPRYLGRAEAALAPWPIGPSTPTSVLLLRGIMLQSNHDFTASLAALRRVVAAQPAAAQAWLTLAAVHQAQANYPAALQDCGQLATHTLGLAPDVCTASAMALTGHAPLALRALGISLAQNAAEAKATPPVAVWAISLQAETAERLGDDSAEGHYRAALAIDPHDPYLLGAWSDWLLDHHRPQDVIALLSGETRIDPLLLRLALAEQAVGSPMTASHVADLAARFETSRLRGDTVHRREEARFVLHLQQQPRRALALARTNWDVQREPADARILLEAALAAGQPAAADPVHAWLVGNAVQDRLLSALDRQCDALAGGRKS